MMSCTTRKVENGQRGVGPRLEVRFGMGVILIEPKGLKDLRRQWFDDLNDEILPGALLPSE